MNEKKNFKNENIRKYSIIVVILLLVITISLSAAYLYAGLTLENQNLGAEFEELNSLVFTKTGDLALDVNQLNAAEGAGNVSGDVTLTATYTGDNASKASYNVYVNVLENTFVYSTEEEYAEVIIRVFEPGGTEVTEIEGLTYVSQNGNQGFDITTYAGLIKIAVAYNIELTEDISEVVQDWKIEIEIVNLDTNQNENSGKTLVTEVSAQVIEDNSTGGNTGEGEDGNTDNNDETTTPPTDVVVPDVCSGDNTFAEGTFQYSIIENGGGVNCDEPNFATTATTNEGIFQTEDVYGPTYYFRGAVEDNWVKFAGFYWRIIRINGDGSVKILYSGDTAPTEATKVVHSTNAQLSTTVAFNTIRTAPEYVGYTYELGSLNNPSVKGSGDSTIKGAIDTWYETNIENQGFSSYIEDTAYCADRTSYSDTAGTSVNSSYNTSPQYFPYYVDLQTNKTPTLLCNDKKDYYTAEDTEIGNAALKYPVSLITANEVAYAGGLRWTGNSNYYLYTGSNYWTLSPYYFTSSNNANVGFVASGGYLNNTNVSSPYGGRPAVSLKSVILTSGNGSWATPYEVKTS